MNKLILGSLLVFSLGVHAEANLTRCPDHNTWKDISLWASAVCGVHVHVISETVEPEVGVTEGTNRIIATHPFQTTTIESNYHANVAEVVVLKIQTTEDSTGKVVFSGEYWLLNGDNCLYNAELLCDDDEYYGVPVHGIVYRCNDSIHCVN